VTFLVVCGDFVAVKLCTDTYIPSEEVIMLFYVHFCQGKNLCLKCTDR